MSTTISRRGLLGAVALAPAIIAAPVSAAARTDLPTMIARWRLAEKACDVASDAHQAALDAWHAASAATPHYTTRRSYLGNGGVTHMSTADRFQPQSAQTMIEMWAGKEWADEACLETCRELIEAHDIRQAEIGRLKIAHGVQAACDEEERLAEISGDLMWAIFEYPVSVPDDLLIKLAFMTETGHFGDTDVTIAVGDDIRRVLKATST